MKIPLIMMFVVLMSMTVLAVGSCMECEKVDVIEGGKATLRYATSGLTNFYEINCISKTGSKIAQYCGPNDNCTTASLVTNVSIEAGHLIISGVNSSKCYSAEPIPGEKKCYNVTVKKPLHSTRSPEISHSKFSDATPFNNSTSDTSGASYYIAGGVVVVLGLVGFGCYKCYGQRSDDIQSKNVPYRNSHQEIHFSVKYTCVAKKKEDKMEVQLEWQPEAANSLLTTVNETQL